MQPLDVTPGAAYAGLAWRFLAVVIDTLLIGLLFVAVLMVGEVLGAIDLASYRGKSPFEISVPGWTYAAVYVLLFAYYTAFELRRSATPGKSAFGLRVMGDDGAPPSARAVLVRNLVRVPEAFFYYIPSAVSCLITKKEQRLGDLAARTVVVRRTTVVTVPAPVVRAPAVGAAQAPAGPALRTAAERLDQALDDLKAAALAVRGAHHNYRRLSEREIERGGGVTADFSPEYAAAWHTLADAVIAMQHANADADDAARLAGVSIQQASASRPDLVYLCRELEPYFTAGSDEEVQEAYLAVARRESAGH